LKLVGVQEDAEKRQFVTVSKWMVHGNVMEYIGKNSANRLELLHGAAQGLKYLHDSKVTHGDLKGANILVSNDTPRRACLADFGFITTVLDPLSCSAQLRGGTTGFMSPELLTPARFRRNDSKPTPQADIYAFGMVTFQVLTGETPFHGVGQGDVVCYVVHDKKRPGKPENASAIGFSDSLWDFTQRCWDEDMELRPEVGEVVTHLEEVAKDWEGLMPPCVQAKNVASDEEGSELEEDDELLSSSQIPALGSSLESQTSSKSFSGQSSSSTGFTEPPQNQSQKVATEPLKEPQPESRVPM